MTIKALPKSEWESFFDRVSKTLGAKAAEIEVAGLDIGDQIEAEWLPLTGLAYDPKDDVFNVIAADELDHLIRRPREIYVDLQVDGLHSVEIVDADDHKQIVQLKEPLALPEPE